MIVVSNLAQVEGDLRLIADSESPFVLHGRLEIFRNSAWGTVCIDGFDLYEADLACRQLGRLHADLVNTVFVLR